MFGWDLGGQKIFVFSICLVEKKSEMIETPVYLNLLSGPYYIRTI